MFLLIPLVPTDTDGTDQTAVSCAINSAFTSAILPLGSGSMLLVDDVGFKSDLSVDAMVSTLAMERFAYVPVTYDDDDATTVTVALNVDHVSSVVPFSDTGCSVICAGRAYKATESLADVSSRLHAIEPKWQGVA